MPFSPETLDFLAENRLHNSKEWFHEHKRQYDELVLRPMAELLDAVAPSVLAVDPLIICEPKAGRCFSRIYRDTRFTNDKSIYRENMWIVFMRDKREQLERPALVFDFSPRGFEYGCGYYCVGRDTLSRIHDRILHRADIFEPADAVLELGFRLEGDSYKRPRYRDVTERQSDWLNRKNLYIMKNSRDYDLLFSDKLSETLSEGFAALRPVYELLMVN